MRTPFDNFPARFGAKYVAEDAASYILYGCDRNMLCGNAVSMERLARYCGLDVRCEYISGDCTNTLGTVAFEPQRIYTQAGVLDLDVPTAVVERDIIERGESGLYNFTLAVLIADTLFFCAEQGKGENGTAEQLSFGLSSVASENRKTVDFVTLTEELDKESAANFALKLALPKVGFKRQTVELYAELGVNRATLDAQKQLPSVLYTLAERYDVPAFAVLARMKELNL